MTGNYGVEVDTESGSTDTASGGYEMKQDYWFGWMEATE